MNTQSLLIAFSISLIIVFVGWLASRKLPQPQQNARFGSFVLVAGTVFFSWFLVIAQPVVQPFSPIPDRKLEYPSELASDEAVLKQLQLQYDRIERLEMEAKKLREDLYEVDQHYSMLLIVLWSTLLGASVLLIIHGRKGRSGDKVDEANF